MITPDMQYTRWSKSFANIVEITRDVLKDQGMDEKQAVDIGLSLALQISEREGGGQFYMPKGDDVRRFLRDVKIWHEFNGRNVTTLAKQYDLTEMRIYQIIDEQRALHVKRAQPDFFQHNA